MENANGSLRRKLEGDSLKSHPSSCAMLLRMWSLTALSYMAPPLSSRFWLSRLDADGSCGYITAYHHSAGFVISPIASSQSIVRLSTN
jgi:hypothetical protein